MEISDWINCMMMRNQRKMYQVINKIMKDAMEDKIQLEKREYFQAAFEISNQKKSPTSGQACLVARVIAENINKYKNHYEIKNGSLTLINCEDENTVSNVEKLLDYILVF